MVKVRKQCDQWKELFEQRDQQEAKKLKFQQSIQ